MSAESDQIARLAIVERGLAIMDAEMGRTRDRLHALEAERAAVQLLSAGLTGLRDEIKAMRGEMRQQLPEATKALRAELQIFARDVAKDEIEDALEKRDTGRTRDFGLRLSTFMGALGFGSLFLSLAFDLHWIH